MIEKINYNYFDIRDYNDKYKIVVNGEDTGKEIEIKKYVMVEGIFLSLREFVEAMGGTIEWNPNKDEMWCLGKFEFMGKNSNLKACFSLMRSMTKNFICLLGF